MLVERATVTETPGNAATVRACAPWLDVRRRQRRACMQVSVHLQGYLRGSRLLSANDLVHITGFDDFQISAIHGLMGRAHGGRGAHDGDAMAVADEKGAAAVEPVLLQKADPAKQVRRKPRRRRTMGPA
jgi:hypothetical protein